MVIIYILISVLALVIGVLSIALILLMTSKMKYHTETTKIN